MSPLAARIRALRAAGMSLRAIMAELGCGYGTAQKHAAGVAVAPVVAAPPPPRPAYYLHCAGPRACNWILSEQRPWRFCPEDVAAPGMVYCRRHEALAMPTQRRVAA